jgi:hypothetical protein
MKGMSDKQSGGVPMWKVLKEFADKEGEIRRGWKMKLRLRGWTTEQIEEQLSKAKSSVRVEDDGSVRFIFDINLPEGETKEEETKEEETEE